MDHQPVKIAVLGALGLVTVAVCVFLLSRRAPGSRSAKASLSGHDYLHEDGEKVTDPLDNLNELADPQKSKGPSSSSPPPTPANSPLAVASRVEVPNGTGSASFSDQAGDESSTTEEADGEADVSRGGGEEDEEEEEEEGHEALVARFNHANSMARKYFKAHRYELAAEHYGTALSLCDRLPNHEDKRTALHNNRGAAYEKSGKYAKSLAECAMCLAREPDHALARVRKSRVLEALGKPVDALNEICAHLLLERDRVLAKALLNPSQPPHPPPPPANLEGLLQKVATARADEILAERAAEKAKESEERKANGGVVAKRKLKVLPKYAVLELLRSFGSFASMERQYKGILESVLTHELEQETGQDASPASRVSPLLDRCKLRLVKRNYEGAREDAFEAAELLTKLRAESDQSDTGVPPDVEAGVWEWQGTFLQLGGRQDEALEAYERCCLALESAGKPCSPDVLIKMGWVQMDNEKPDEAEKYLTRAIEADPDYGSSYAHRARLHPETEGNDVVKGYLEKALERNKNDVFSWERLVKLHIEMGDVEAGMKAVEDGLRHVHKAESLLTLKQRKRAETALDLSTRARRTEFVKYRHELLSRPTALVKLIVDDWAELKYSIAVRMGDASQGPALEDLFEEAVKADPSSPTVYLNKAAFLMQMMQDFQGAKNLLEKAVEVDPTCVHAILQLANFKVQTAKTLEDAEAVASLLNEAVVLCEGREELTETLSVLVATEARMQGAKLLGRTSLG